MSKFHDFIYLSEKRHNRYILSLVLNVTEIALLLAILFFPFFRIQTGEKTFQRINIISAIEYMYQSAQIFQTIVRNQQIKN